MTPLTSPLITVLAYSPFDQEGAANLGYLLSLWRDNEDLPLSRLQTPLVFFLDPRYGQISLDLAGAPAVQAAAVPSSPPLRR